MDLSSRPRPRASTPAPAAVSPVPDPPSIADASGPLPLAAAWDAVRALVPRTPLVRDPWLSARNGREVWLKLENLQETGSFKVRGAAARLAALGDEARSRGVVACSSGNHGRAVAWVAARMGIPATISVPAWIDPVKLAAIRAAGARVLADAASYDEAEQVALEVARSDGLEFVAPFDDPHVAAGQGTVALEILERIEPPFEVAVPLSGGGLAGGMAVAFQSGGQGVRITAVSAARADVMLRSLEAGRPVEVPEEPTLAGALAGGIGLDNRLTFGLVRDRIEGHLRVDEPAIRGAMVDAALRLRTVVEGGGAVALAAAHSGQFHAGGDAAPPLVIVVSGGNVAPATLVGLLAGGS